MKLTKPRLQMLYRLANGPCAIGRLTASESDIVSRLVKVGFATLDGNLPWNKYYDITSAGRAALAELDKATKEAAQ